MHGAEWIKDAIVFLIAAGVIVPLVARLRISSVLGFLLAGLIIGPYGLGRFAGEYEFLNFVTISDPHAVQPLAEIGVIFLLFLLGLELSFGKLWALRRWVFGAGGGQTLLSAAVIGVALAALLPVNAAIALALALCLSSTAIVMQLLAEQRRTSSEAGRASLSVLLFQDVMVAPILIAVSAMARPDSGVLTALAQSAVLAIIVVGAIVLIGRFVLRPVLRVPARAGRREFMLALVFAIALLAALGTEAAGLSLALGAFLAGLLVGETEYRYHVETDLEPFKGLLIGLFFVAVGMEIDLVWAASRAHWIILAVVAVLLIKALTVYLAQRVFGVSRKAAIESSLLLAPPGEFGFVIIGSAAALGLLSGEVAALVTIVIGSSMMLTPVLPQLAPVLIRLTGRPAESDTESVDESPDKPGNPPVVIGGFGRVGQYIARVLEAENVDYLAIESDADLVKTQRALGKTVYFGDASRKELLERIGAGAAEHYLITVGSESMAERLAEAAKQVSPDAVIISRAHNAAHGNRLLRAGVDEVVPEALEAGLQLAGIALRQMGAPESDVQRRLSVERDTYYARLGLRED